MASRDEYRINFRIQPSDDLKTELDRLSRAISQKYRKDIRIVLREVGKR